MTTYIRKDEINIREKLHELEGAANKRLRRPPSFRVDLSSAPSIPTGTWTVYPAATVHWDTHGTYDTGTHTYVVPVSGIYLFNATQWWANLPEGRTISRISINGTPAAYHYELTNAGGSWTHQSMHNLTKGDEIQIQVHQDSGTSRLLDPSDLNNGWTGVMVSGNEDYYSGGVV